MALFPLDPPPSSVNLAAAQPAGRSFSVTGRPQTRVSGTHTWELKVGYSGLEFGQRDIILATISDLQTTGDSVDFMIPSHSENNEVTAPTANVSSSLAAGQRVLVIKNLSGKLKHYNLIKFASHDKVYSVSSPSTVVGGVQTVTLTPALRQSVSVDDVINVKDVPINFIVSSDEIGSDNQGMESSVKFTLVENK